GLGGCLGVLGACSGIRRVQGVSQCRVVVEWPAAGPSACGWWVFCPFRGFLPRGRTSWFPGRCDVVPVLAGMLRHRPCHSRWENRLITDKTGTHRDTPQSQVVLACSRGYPDPPPSPDQPRKWGAWGCWGGWGCWGM